MLLLSLCQIFIFVFNSLQQINDISLVSLTQNVRSVHSIFSPAQSLTAPT